MFFVKLAWRNLWRNQRRTAITLTAVGLNTAILILSYALMDGMMVHTISNATNLVTGEVQIHAPGYLARRSFFEDIGAPDAVLNAIRSKGLAAASRSYADGLVAHGAKSAGARFWGVDPQKERETFKLYEHMQAGRFLSEAPRREIVLGKKLARSLKAGVGSEIVAVVQAADGSLGNDLYTVAGILKAAGEGMDRSAAIVHKEDFEALFVSGGRIHEIAVNSRGRMRLADLASVVSRAAPGLEVKTWRQLLPALSDMANLVDAGIWIFGAIFFLAAGLGVMNTMLMATFERFGEIGVVKALGTAPWRILRDISTEAFLLGLLSSIAGAGLGLAGSYFFQEVGLDTRVFAGEMSLAGVAFDPVWRAVIHTTTVFAPVAAMWVTCVLAALYPAAIAARLEPVRAIRHT